MKPKEKAKEIYCKYTEALNIRDLQTTANPFAVQCALIAVDVILFDCGAKDWAGDEACDGRNYWQEVKSELQSL